MKDQIEFDLLTWRADDAIDLIVNGKLGLPDFQRRFEWPAADVKAFLSTVLGGLPSGAIMIAENQSIKVALRELEGAPKLQSDQWETLVLLDGQQRLTALLQATMGVGPDEYFVNFAALAAGASVLEDDVLLARRRGRRFPVSVNPADLVPFAALRHAHAFYGWLNSEGPGPTSRDWGGVFSAKIHPVSAYTIPVTRLRGALDLATVAQVFERTNKWGQRLDAFDLLVARLRAGGWSLRSAWDDALRSYPSIHRVFGENGLTTISAIALRNSGNVRRDAILSMFPGDIEQDWEPAVSATDAVARLLLGEGVRTPDLLAYETLATALIAAKLEGVDDKTLIRYYWLAATNRWHETASNTQVVRDVRYLAEGAMDPVMPRSLPVMSEFVVNTRRSSRALSSVLQCALLTANPHDLVTGQPVTSADPEGEDIWHLVPLVSGGGQFETPGQVPTRLRTLAQVFSAPGVGNRLRRQGLMRVLNDRANQIPLFGRELGQDLASQLLPDDAERLREMRPEELVEYRAIRVLELIERRIQS